MDHHPSLSPLYHEQSPSARTSRTRINQDMEPPESVSIAPSIAPEDRQEEQAAEEEEQPVPQTPQTAITFLLVSGRRRTMLFDPETTVGRVKELVWNAWPSGACAASIPTFLIEATQTWSGRASGRPAPSYLRILYLGKILQDEDTLTIPRTRLPLLHPAVPNAPSDPATTPPPQPTIVHLSIRAYAPPPDDPAKPKKSRRRRTATGASEGDESAAPAGGPNGGEEEGGCCCVVC
ncbi:hypothetical protein C8R43DRAFT_1141216 [Mycena crocata]|nr:hypothetical protein C8R43DRAFT_1141216 [Mycena crocata]